jgi:hypothetical protein
MCVDTDQILQLFCFVLDSSCGCLSTKSTLKLLHLSSTRLAATMIRLAATTSLHQAVSHDDQGATGTTAVASPVAMSSGGIPGGSIVEAKSSPAAMSSMPAACSWAATSTSRCPCWTIFWAAWTMDERACWWLLRGMPLAAAFAYAVRLIRSTLLAAAFDTQMLLLVPGCSLLPVAAAVAAVLAADAICARCMACSCLASSAALAAVTCEGDRERLAREAAIMMIQADTVSENMERNTIGE